MGVREMVEGGRAGVLRGEVSKDRIDVDGHVRIIKYLNVVIEVL